MNTNSCTTNVITKKLTRHDAVEMRRAALAGAATKELAERYGVGVHTVRGVLRYARFMPELTPARQEGLAKFALARGCTLDDALDALLAEARP
jgi:predicted xylose isomerase-like sugar epimerase